MNRVNRGIHVVKMGAFLAFVVSTSWAIEKGVFAQTYGACTAIHRACTDELSCPSCTSICQDSCTTAPVWDGSNTTSMCVPAMLGYCDPACPINKQCSKRECGCKRGEPEEY